MAEENGLAAEKKAMKKRISINEAWAKYVTAWRHLHKAEKRQTWRRRHNVWRNDIIPKASAQSGIGGGGVNSDE
jgi:hypothetical protein